jgi:hypothetical protein
MLASRRGVTDPSPAAVHVPPRMCDPVRVTSLGDFLTARLHIDLQRVFSAACPA